ncbi:unnamed protein product [Penicillium salamii]|uniref:Uncharacterized protein n=1 Tax=Penicillium salamii TaxID=1612424 RepID=A0A9W4J749_9EURO|nr:unnamed protein product [Penicillium salamii]CAG7979525.1 unnamed protein product [Penicillium salamii]CAG8079520.1 unnamed protein product [Penicillium salamii]CAG8083152.1 unnamed protein product [Penicillium salamii]CAG8236873.1 unnamed protein product [Penicillium salamii]
MSSRKLVPLPTALASTISNARLGAGASLRERDPETFIALTKNCMDAHTQATKAMIEELQQRMDSGEEFDWETEYDEIKNRLSKYCESLVEEAEMSLAPDELDCPVKSSVDLVRHLKDKSSINSLQICTSLSTTSPTVSSHSGGSKISPALSMPDSFGEGYLLASSRQRLRLFAVSSEDWVKYVSEPLSVDEFEVMLPEGLTQVDESIHLGVVMGILTKLYTMAKLMQTILISYGLETDSSRLGLMHWTKQCEENAKSTDLKTLINIVENLFYSLYARVVIELASVELCIGFRPNPRSLASHRPFLLPEPAHLYRIIIAFKDALDAPNICANFRKDTALHFQQDYITQIADKIKTSADVPRDSAEYRLYAEGIVGNRNGPYCTKWKTLVTFFSVIPVRVMVLLSEHYLAVAPVSVMPDDIPFDELPFINPDQIEEKKRDAETKKDHHTATLAMLEGTTIGDERLKDPKFRIYYLAKQRKCVCPGLCRCAVECTQKVVRCCPCAERQVRVMKTKRDLRSISSDLDFETTAGTMARMCFYGLASLRCGVTDRQIWAELQRAFDLMDGLITNERGKDKNPRRENSKRSS